MRYMHFCVRLGGDHSQRALVGDSLEYRFAAICLVRDDGQRRLFPIQKRAERLAIMSLSACDSKTQGLPQRIYSRVNLTAATSA